MQMAEYKDLIDLVLALFFLLTFIFIALFYFFTINIDKKFKTFEEKLFVFDESIKKEIQLLNEKKQNELLYLIDQNKEIKELIIKSYENNKMKNENLSNQIINLKNIENENSKCLNIIKRKIMKELKGSVQER